MKAVFLTKTVVIIAVFFDSFNIGAKTLKQVMRQRRETEKVLEFLINIWSK